jgi:tetratricopeptide (TPR) repeat protein
MKKILLLSFLFLSLVLCLVSPGWGDDYLDEFAAGLGAEERGDYDDAIRHFTKAIELDPRSFSSYYGRGNSWYAKGDYDRAIADYTKAIELNSRYVAAYYDLAWLLATCPEGRYRDGKRAVELAEKALELEESPFMLDTLAAAYAEAGRFQGAIKAEERAIVKLMIEKGNVNDIAEFEKHLASYKAGRPWREK